MLGWLRLARPEVKIKNKPPLLLRKKQSPLAFTDKGALFLLSTNFVRFNQVNSVVSRSNTTGMSIRLVGC